MVDTRGRVLNNPRFVSLLARIYSIPLLLLGFLVYLRYRLDLPFPYFTRDPAAFAGFPAYLGLYSNLGMMVWGFSTGVLWFTFWIVRERGRGDGVRRYLLTSAILTTVLFFDDFFQFHEAIIPGYLGIPQTLVLAGYAAWALVWLMMNLPVIRKAEPLLLFSSLAFFGLAVVFDFLEDTARLPGHHLWEDGSKFLGIFGWCVYFVRVSLREVRAFHQGHQSRA